MQIANKPATTSSHTIPIDVLLDIIRILFNNRLHWQVEAINEQESTLLVQISQQQGNPKHQKALQNIIGILGDYNYYVKGTPQDEAIDY
ncbi:hypothetical protein [Chitinophaga ginsengisegetis]|uniref:hypothetical protein n=1 Tax=Chitinophaga ginsengisegetis TaxID=393003 RepID=UPI000DBABC1C|nr:hypothetical protein [Chitinophaga ginsengisegetis]MDR6571024.1 proline dehydrogenase [Chitinophaga ginsengisegetis]MDR6650758.1 proline dehydrogenase [Chitinophaga ginsengisegetis]MDR6657108.1 proline dehydrogenase [Chitinophaga ginsengisegetis]